MLSYVTWRVVRLVLSLVAVSIITFGMLQLVPGSFAELSDVDSTELSGSEAVEVVGELQDRYEAPAWRQYLNFMRGLATWDMGPSYKFPQSTVEELIADAFPVSVSLAAMAIVLALLIAVPAGVLTAVKKDKLADYGSMFFLTTIQALPGYLAAVALVLVFSSWLGLLPTKGWDTTSHLIIPVVALAVQPIAMLARYVRSSMLEALGEEYVIAAYAKGGRRRIVLVRHVLRNSLIPLVTVAGPIFASLATGTVFVEVLLDIPGLGRLFTLAARTRDMPLLMGTTLFFALIFMLINAIVDLTYGLLDPRIRHQRAGGSRGSRRPRRPTRPEAPPARDPGEENSTLPRAALSDDVAGVVRP